MPYGFAHSTEGYNHIKVNKVCEDASGHYSDEIMSVVVVADGHGSDNYPRTDHGSYFAVQAATQAIKEFVHTITSDGLNVAEASDSYMEQLVKNILSHWYAAVEQDIARYPFSEQELEKVAEKYKRRYLAGERVEKAYGTTLIAVCETKDFWFGLQIGDGKCVCIMSDGSIEEPIPWDDDCQANITTSICDSEAFDEFRYCFRSDKPIATFIGTDGVDDSYANDEELHGLYRSMLTIFVEHGAEIGSKEVKDFLPNLSRKGSGDDISVAGLVTTSISPAFLTLLKAQSEFAEAKSSQEKLEREVALASETLEYVSKAMQKAKASFETAAQKVDDAQAAVSNARNAYAEAIRRYERATVGLNLAKQNYETSVETKTINEGLAVSTAVESEVPDNLAIEVEPEAPSDVVTEAESEALAETIVGIEKKSEDTEET